MKASGYSLWLMPNEKLAYFKNIVDELSSKYNAPKFKPHITLLGELMLKKDEVISKTFELARLIDPFKIKIKGVDYQEAYFRCLYITVDKAPELMNLNNKARDIFNREKDEPFMPHLSLLYGKYMQQIKDKIIASLEKFDFEVLVDSVHVVKTDGLPEDWTIVKEINLGKL